MSFPISARERHDLCQLLPIVPSDATSQTSLQGRGNTDTALDFYQILPGPALGRPPHHPYLLHLRRGRNAGRSPLTICPTWFLTTLIAGVRQDRPAGRHRHTPEQPLPDLPPGPAGPLQVGHRGGLAGDHVRLHQQARGQVRPAVGRQRPGRAGLWQ